MKKNPNLLIIGASGGVANALLHHLNTYRSFFNELVLLDKDKKVLTDPYINHELLKYTFIHKEIILPKKEKEYLEILKKHKIDIVLDITDMESESIISATNKAHVSYINTAMCNDVVPLADVVFGFDEDRKKIKNAPHILCSGMNPGNVNMWVRYGIEKFGLPKEIVHFEYDTSKIAKQWHPMMTWSVHEFIEESILDPGGMVLGRNKIKELFPNAIENRVDMTDILSPILKIDKYPFGFSCVHEENLTIAQKYDIPSRFIYAINQDTMKNIVALYDKKQKVTAEDMILGDNTTEILEGSDSIGVILDYPDKKVYYFNSISNLAIIGTNATYTQVVIGICAAIFTLMFSKLKPGIYFVEDLYDTYYPHFMFDNMRVQEFVFHKTKDHLKLTSYDPMIKTKRDKKFKDLYII